MIEGETIKWGVKMIRFGGKDGSFRKATNVFLAEKLINGQPIDTDEYVYLGFMPQRQYEMFKRWTKKSVKTGNPPTTKFYVEEKGFINILKIKKRSILAKILTHTIFM
tara:strand:- start:99 stop:422 length:324 start_codon:yes stop_codon:yes gene_type:complete